MAMAGKTHVRAIAAAGAFSALALHASVTAWAQAQEPVCTQGQMVDFCRVVNPGFAYLRDRKGAFTSFAFPGAKLTIVFDINNRGQMVGTYVDAAGPTSGGFTHGFLLEDGTFTTIDFPGPSETEILGINDRGEMVGTYIDAQGIIHGFLFADGVFTTIDSPDAAMETVLFGINDRGTDPRRLRRCGRDARGAFSSGTAFSPTSPSPAPCGPRASTSTTAA